MITSLPTTFDCLTGFDKKDAQAAFVRDGSIVLSNLNPNDDPWSEIASKIPGIVWDRDDLLLEKHRADAVHTEHVALKLHGLALPAHSDGYMWGDKFPDLVILACEEPADNQGGANYLIDGYYILDQLPDSTKTLMENALVDHTERNDYSVTEGAESIIPVIRYLRSTGWRVNNPTVHGENNDRLCWRRMATNDATTSIAEATDKGLEIPYTSLWAAPKNTSSDNAQAVADALRKLDQIIVSAERKAPRFALKKGEALIIDNYRMLHARDAFQGSESKRRMWRVWSWTNESFGLPPDIKPSGEGVPANILERS